MSTGEGEQGSNSAELNTRVALYRKYRPTSLDQVVGQPQVTDVLAAAARENAFAHAYLFTGQRGTGKTTVARILAHLINHLDYSDNLSSDNVDIIEIDAASNNGVDDVRAIRDSVQLAPMNCSHKVYIIDEFHMLSKPAFNALLKTIEEPPEYVVFILATTELQKVPATILSRVQRFHFRPLPSQLLAGHLRMIANQEHITVDDDALLLIAERGGGSVRDSITLLDQLSGNDHISVATVNDILGLTSVETIDRLISLVEAGQSGAIVKLVHDIIGDGTSPAALVEQLVSRLEQRAADQPALYDLIGRIIDVGKSALPEAKLLATLVCYNLPAASSEARVVQPKAATPIHPSSNSETELDQPRQTQTLAPSAVAEPAPSYDNQCNNDKETAATAEDVAASAPTQPAAEAPATPADSTGSAESIDFDWDDLLQKLSDMDYPSVRSILEQADFRYNPASNELTLFFGRAFYRKRAQGQSFAQELDEALGKLYDHQPAVIVSDDSAPADSDVAAVLSVVGGEVTKINDGQI